MLLASRFWRDAALSQAIALAAIPCAKVRSAFESLARNANGSHRIEAVPTRAAARASGMRFRLGVLCQIFHQLRHFGKGAHCIVEMSAALRSAQLCQHTFTNGIDIDANQTLRVVNGARAF